MKVVHESPQHLCRYCGKRFSFAMALHKHIGNRHDAEQLKPRQCTSCNKVFKSNCHLKIHINQVHGDLNWKCKLCDAAYTSRNALTIHVFSHLNQRPLNCHLCSNGYYTIAYMRKHYEKRHHLFLTNDKIYKTCRRIFIDDGLIKKSD